MLRIRRVVAVGLLHDVLSSAQSFLPLPFGRVVRLSNALLVTKAAAAVRLRVGVTTGFRGILKIEKSNLKTDSFNLISCCPYIGKLLRNKSNRKSFRYEVRTKT